MADPVLRIETLDLALQPFEWGFARDHRAEIDAHFEMLRQEKPRMWNGRVLLMQRHEFVGNVLHCACFEADFASFVAWRDWGFPDPSVTNCFALGALQGSDGGFVLGVMGSHTVNAGQVYFPGGTPDLDDVAGTRVDLDGSVRREVREETGLDLSDFDIDSGWLCVPAGPMIALLKPMRGTDTAERICARILDHIADDSAPELAGAVIARRPADIDPKMPAFVQTFLRHQWT